jgi:hypothetical protein
VDNAVRIPDAALAFRPTEDISSARKSDSTVWLYDGARFTPVAVQTGLSDDQWTELAEGPLHPGEAPVMGVTTSATFPPLQSVSLKWFR